jgi:hypothetical protein
MALVRKTMGVLVDIGLYLGLIVALWGVYSVETRLPRPQVAKARDGYVPHVTVEKGLSGTTKIVTYELRTRPDKKKWIAEFGGSPETEVCVQAGLDWLVRHQAEDGSWSPDCLGPSSRPHSRCEGGEWCDEAGRDFRVAQTGLALLALQAAGNYESNEEKYSDAVRRGIRWLIENQRPDGAMVGPLSYRDGEYQQSFMYEHAIAAFAMAEACAVRKAQGKPEERRLLTATLAAISFIEEQQHDDGGWRYSTQKEAPSDTSVSGWAMLALKSAREAELPVKQETIDRTRSFFQSCETPHGLTSYMHGTGASSDALVGVGMLTHLLLLKESAAPLVKTSARHLAGRADELGREVRSGQAEFYTLYNATLAMYQAGGADWDRWNNAIRDAVVAIQDKGPGCRRGSWDPRGSTHGPAGGRIYNTALGTLTLEVYYRFTREEEKPGAQVP